MNTETFELFLLETIPEELLIEKRKIFIDKFEKFPELTNDSFDSILVLFKEANKLNLSKSEAMAILKKYICYDGCLYFINQY